MSNQEIARTLKNNVTSIKRGLSNRELLLEINRRLEALEKMVNSLDRIQKEDQKK